MALPTGGRNRIDEKYEKGLGAYENAGIDQAESFANDPNNHAVEDESERDGSSDGLRREEESPRDNPNPMNYNPDEQPAKKSARFSIRSLVSRRKGPIAIMTFILSAFGIGFGISAPTLLPVATMQNITEKNDTSSTSMDRRFPKPFGAMTKDSDPVCKHSSKRMKCHMGRISNKALNKMQKHGVTAIFDADAQGNGGTRHDGKKTGYPDKNPSHYEFDMGNGKTEKVSAAKLTEFLSKKDNRKIANKLIGRVGAFRVSAWSGKHITKKLYDKFNLSRKGGYADGSHKRMTAKERMADMRKRVKERIPGLEKMSNATDAIKKRVSKQMTKAKKGGTAYLLAVGGCIGVRAPGYIAAGVAAVQLAQLLPMSMDFVLSPGAKLQASGEDKDNAVTPDDIDAIGSELTRKTKDSDGKMTSALDSSILLAAMGVNKNKPSMNKGMTPGFSILKDQTIRESREIANATDQQCNTILSPAAMWTAFTVDSAVTVTLSSTLIGGIAKIAASWVAGEIIAAAVKAVVADKAADIIKGLAKSEIIPNAEGKDLGDAIGTSAFAFFSAGGQANHLSVLSESQLTAYEQMRQENIEFTKEMDIASLSPFDTSSRHTFAGNIVHSLQIASIQSRSNPLSILSAISNPFRVLTRTAQAADSNVNSCSYAEAFDLNTDDPSSTPAVNVAGLPCTGLTSTQDRMSTEEAIELLEAEDWICSGDNCPEIKDGDLIEDLMPKTDDGYNGSGYIKADTPLYEFINSCSNPDTGDYLFAAGGCIARENVTGGAGVKATSSESFETKNSNGDTIDVSASTAIDGVQTDVEGVKNPRSIQAMSVFLLDYQITQSINGENDQEMGSDTSTEPTGDIVHYRQYDPEWADTPFSGDTFDESGCGPTSMAIIIASLVDSSVKPPDVGAVFGAQSGGTSSFANALDGVRAKWGSKVEINQVSSFDEAYDFLKSGKGMVWMGGSGNPPFTGGGHVIALAGVADDGKVIVADPWGGRTSRGGMHQDIANYPKSELANSAGGMFTVAKK